MRKKDWALVALVLVLFGVYAIYFTDWFGPKMIRIEHTARSVREAYGPRGRRVEPPGEGLGAISFSLHKNYRITSLKLIAADDATNPYPHFLWQLGSKDGSTPIDALSYGMPVVGMTSVVATLAAEPLQPGVAYRLLVEAKSWKGTHDFTMPGAKTASR